MSATSHRPRLGALAALALLAAAAACPLPQPLPGVTRLDGGTITPPRISVASAQPSNTILYYDPAACQVVGAVPFALSGSVVDQNTDEVIDVRWFIDYDKGSYTANPWQGELIAAPPEPDQFVRSLEPRTFNPARDTSDANALHVVEVVVTNGGFANDPLPNRSAAPGYEVEIFRWVFQPKTGFGYCGDRPP